MSKKLSEDLAEETTESDLVSSSSSLISSSLTTSSRGNSTELDHDLVSRSSKRSCVITELFETEQTYIDSLLIMVKIFAPMMKERFEPLLTSNITYSLSQVEMIFKINLLFFRDLKNKVINATTEDAFAGIFLEHAPGFRLYTMYTRSLPECRRDLQQMRRNHPAFDMQLRKVENSEESHKQTLSSLLVQPVQRICRYPLLMKEILKCMSQADADYETLTRVDALLKETATFVNESDKQYRQKVRLTELQATLAPPEPFVSRGRRLRREWVVGIVDPGDKRRSQPGFCLLCTDVIFLTVAKPESAAQDALDSLFFMRVPLVSCAVDRSEQYEIGVRLKLSNTMVPKKGHDTIVLIAQSAREFGEMLKKLRKYAALAAIEAPQGSVTSALRASSSESDLGAEASSDGSEKRRPAESGTGSGKRSSPFKGKGSGILRRRASTVSDTSLADRKSATGSSPPSPSLPAGATSPPLSLSSSLEILPAKEKQPAKSAGERDAAPEKKKKDPKLSRAKSLDVIDRPGMKVVKNGTAKAASGLRSGGEEAEATPEFLSNTLKAELEELRRLQTKFREINGENLLLHERQKEMEAEAAAAVAENAALRARIKELEATSETMEKIQAKFRVISGENVLLKNTLAELERGKWKEEK